MMKKLPLIFTIILFSSCTEVLFETPQPMGSMILKKFPKELRGTFIKGKDTITINKHSISTTLHNLEPEVISKDTVIKWDISRFDKDRIHIAGLNVWLEFEYRSEKDSIISSKKAYLFDIKKGDELRVSGSHYYLNASVYDSLWTVKKIIPSDTGLAIASMQMGKIEKIRTITNTKPWNNPINKDSSYYIIEPTGFELEKLYGEESDAVEWKGYCRIK